MNILLPIGELSKNLRERESNKIDVKQIKSDLKVGKRKIDTCNPEEMESRFINLKFAHIRHGVDLSKLTPFTYTCKTLY